jgi:glutamate dehydrogenase (NAD(P)+)
MPPQQKEHVIRAFARAIAGLTEYVPGPDMGTDELAMGWVYDEMPVSIEECKFAADSSGRG